MEFLSIIAFIAAIPFRLDIGFRNFNKEIGLELSSSKMGTGYQDAITPPKLNYVSYVFWPLNLFIIFAGFADFGVVGFIILGIFILSNVLTGIFILPKLDRFFLRILFKKFLLDSTSGIISKFVVEDETEFKLLDEKEDTILLRPDELYEPSWEL